MDLARAFINSRLRSPRSLTPDELRALWRLRLGQLSLKPDISRERDFERFVGDYQHDGLVWLLYEGGEIVGTYLQRTKRLEHDGRRVLALAPEYVFMAPHLRGHPILLAAVIALTVLPILRHPLRRPYASGCVYPSAYIAWRRLVAPCWSLGDPDVTDPQRALVARIGSFIWGDAWAPDGTVSFRTLPRPTTPRSRTGRAILASYEAMNPDWRSGRALFFLTPLGPATVWNGIARSVAATVRRPAKRAHPAPGAGPLSHGHAGQQSRSRR